MGFMLSNAAAASLGWGKRSWQVNHAKDLNGGAGTSQRDQTCSQVPGRKSWGGKEWWLLTHSCAPFLQMGLGALWLQGQVPLPHFFSFCRNLKIGYFSQHHVDQLDLNISAVELLARKFPGRFWRCREIWAVSSAPSLMFQSGFPPQNFLLGTASVQPPHPEALGAHVL